MKLDPDQLVSSALLGFVVVAIAAVAWESCVADAQPIDAHAEVSPELLADALRVRISEADFRPECEGEHRGVWYPRGCVTDGAAIVQRHWRAARRRGTTLHHELRAYSRRATGQDAPRSPRGAWVAALTLDFSAPPAGWPERIRWSSRVSALEQIRGELDELLRLALRYRPVRVCAGNDYPDHWGGVACDGDRIGACDRVPSCWRRLDCGPTVNGFYVVECRAPRTLPASVARGRR